jgi:hypothetical protein
VDAIPLWGANLLIKVRGSGILLLM